MVYRWIWRWVQVCCKSCDFGSIYPITSTESNTLLRMMSIWDFFSSSESPSMFFSALAMIFICLRMVDFPLSPVPRRRSFVICDCFLKSSFSPFFISLVISRYKAVPDLKILDIPVVEIRLRGGGHAVAHDTRHQLPGQVIVWSLFLNPRHCTSSRLNQEWHPHLTSMIIKLNSW